jgi:hypothetical protein
VVAWSKRPQQGEKNAAAPRCRSALQPRARACAAERPSRAPIFGKLKLKLKLKLNLKLKLKLSGPRPDQMPTNAADRE